jgi:hypothetical protein
MQVVVTPVMVMPVMPMMPVMMMAPVMMNLRLWRRRRVVGVRDAWRGDRRHGQRRGQDEFVDHDFSPFADLNSADP